MINASDNDEDYYEIHPELKRIEEKRIQANRQYENKYSE